MDYIERIKKPSRHVYNAGRMLCLLVCIFREEDSKVASGGDGFENWNSIQSFMLYQPNSNKFFKELQAIKQTLLSGVKPLDKLLVDLDKLQKEYFPNNFNDENQILKVYSNKSLKSLVYLVIQTIRQTKQLVLRSK